MVSLVAALDVARIELWGPPGPSFDFDTVSPFTVNVHLPDVYTGIAAVATIGLAAKPRQHPTRPPVELFTFVPPPQRRLMVKPHRLITPWSVLFVATVAALLLTSEKPSEPGVSYLLPPEPWTGPACAAVLLSAPLPPRLACVSVGVDEVLQLFAVPLHRAENEVLSSFGLSALLGAFDRSKFSPAQLCSPYRSSTV